MKKAVQFYTNRQTAQLPHAIANKTYRFLPSLPFFNNSKNIINKKATSLSPRHNEEDGGSFSESLMWPRDGNPESTLVATNCNRISNRVTQSEADKMIRELEEELRFNEQHRNFFIESFKKLLLENEEKKGQGRNNNMEELVEQNGFVEDLFRRGFSELFEQNASDPQFCIDCLLRRLDNDRKEIHYSQQLDPLHYHVHVHAEYAVEKQQNGDDAFFVETNLYLSHDALRQQLFNASLFFFEVDNQEKQETQSSSSSAPFSIINALFGVKVINNKLPFVFAQLVANVKTKMTMMRLKKSMKIVILEMMNMKMKIKTKMKKRMNKEKKTNNKIFKLMLLLLLHLLFLLVLFKIKTKSRMKKILVRFARCYGSKIWARTLNYGISFYDIVSFFI